VTKFIAVLEKTNKLDAETCAKVRAFVAENRFRVYEIGFTVYGLENRFRVYEIGFRV
jgi:hypothetical protein